MSMVGVPLPWVRSQLPQESSEITETKYAERHRAKGNGQLPQESSEITETGGGNNEVVRVGGQLPQESSEITETDRTHH